MAERKEKCETCRFWDEDGDDADGICRRYAPRPEMNERGQDGDAWETYPAWPLTVSTDWCGEWQAIELPVVPPGQ